jgi:hypothetical protein
MLHVCSGLTEKAIPLIQAGLVPDSIVRWGIRLQLKNHLNLLASEDCEAELARKTTIVASLREMPIAIETTAANEQHYEVPAEFYTLCLVRISLVALSTHLLLDAPNGPLRSSAAHLPGPVQEVLVRTLAEPRHDF